MSADHDRYLHPAERIAHAAACQSRQLTSTGVKLHIDWYPQPGADAPAVVINYGGGGHAGLFARLALAFHARGYAVAVPDQRGQGRSGGARGDFSVAEAVQNIEDVYRWVRQRTSGPVHLLGSSIGGGLAYAAGASLVRRGEAPAAIACLNLYDFGDARTGLAFSRFAWLARVPGLAVALRTAMRALARRLPQLRVPYRTIANFSAMLDTRDLAQDAYDSWRADPLALKAVTLRALLSLMDTPAAIPFAANTALAVLVINPTRDRMVRPALTRRSFEQLGGPKAYREIPFGHFSLQDDFGAKVVGLAHDWFRQQSCAPAHPG